MTNLALLQKQESPLIPGELPRHRHRHRRLRLHKHSVAVRDNCLGSLSVSDCFSSTNVADVSAEQDHLSSACQTQKTETEEELKKIVQKLDNIMERLVKTCRLEPADIEPHNTTRTKYHNQLLSSEESITARFIEDSIDKIICKISERQPYIRAGNEQLCGTPPRVWSLQMTSPQAHHHSANKSGSPKSASRTSPYSIDQCTEIDKKSTTPPRAQHIQLNGGTPKLTARPSPLGLARQRCNDSLMCHPLDTSAAAVASRSLLPRFDSLGKEAMQTPPSPNAGNITKTKSGRFASAISFLTSPKKSGSNYHRGGILMER